MTPDALRPCPSSPNCVSTQDDDATHGAQPIAFGGSAQGAMAAVLASMGALDRIEVVERDDRYVHAVATTRLLRFKDDVELLVDADGGVIHYRSASRVGHSDLGVNRRRMDALAADIARRLAG